MQPLYEIRADAWADGSKAIIASFGSSFAIQPDGSLWAWGNNGNGQLGDGTNVDRHSPVKIMDDVVTVETNGRFTMAVRTDNTLWIWGAHELEQPEIEGIIDRYIPTKLLDDVVAVASTKDAIWNTVMAIRTDGNLWAAGRNTTGLLIEDPETYGRRFSFEKIMDDVAAVTLGAGHALAIRNDGSLWAWGRNNGGQLGDNTTVDRHEPIHIMDNVSSVSAALNTSAAVTNDGSLWIWGWVGISMSTVLREEGESTIFELHSPERLYEDVRKFSLHNRFVLAISTDNNLYGLGYNGSGQLGDGTNNSPFEWIRIMDDVDYVVAGDETVLAIDADGSLLAWGNNERGVVGDNTTINRPRPVQIMDSFMSMGPPVIVAAGAEDPNVSGQEESAHDDSDTPITGEVNDIELPNVELPEGIELPGDIELPEGILPDGIELPGEIELPDISDEIVIVPDTQQTTTLLLTIGAFIIILIQIAAIAISSYHLHSLSKRRIN